MADNVVAESVVTAGLTFAADDISSVYYPRTKLVHGADGVNDGDVSTANPLPTRLYAGTTALSVGAGVVGTGVLRVTHASDDPVTTSVQLLDDAIVADDAAFTPATTKVLMAGFEFDDTTPDSVGEGDAGAARMSANRCIYVNVRDNAGNERGLSIDANGALAVSTVTTVTAVTSITNALPAGTNAIGKLAANTGVDIGDVDVTSIIPGTGATNLGKAIDTATGATDTGVLLLATRDDALSSLTPAEGDNVQLRVNSTGALYVDMATNLYTVDVAAPAAPTGPTMLAERDDALSTLSEAEGDWTNMRANARGALWVGVEGTLVDDAAFAPGTSLVVPMGCQADETSADSVDEGDIGCPRMTLDRYQRVVAEHESSSVRSGGTARTPVFVVIDHATSGDNTIVAALGAGVKCRVLALHLRSAGTATVRFESGTGGTALTGQMSLLAQSEITLPFSPVGWFETAANTLLNMELSAAVSMDGMLVYIPTS